MDTAVVPSLPQLENDDPGYIHQLRLNFVHICSFWRDAESLMEEND
jgi:hypothetical protein